MYACVQDDVEDERCVLQVQKPIHRDTTAQLRWWNLACPVWPSKWCCPDQFLAGATNIPYVADLTSGKPTKSY